MTFVFYAVIGEKEDMPDKEKVEAYAAKIAKNFDRKMMFPAKAEEIFTFQKYS